MVHYRVWLDRRVEEDGEVCVRRSIIIAVCRTGVDHTRQWDGCEAEGVGLLHTRAAAGTGHSGIYNNLVSRIKFKPLGWGEMERLLNDLELARDLTSKRANGRQRTVVLSRPFPGRTRGVS